ncbi:glycoside hydrolase family 16 protein [Actinoplanes sp. NPDC051851]|uniref:glycoside hydrolase family 16 protein n=1 Tax=Actinoplanes sp. NPDC051851 TaxID=3154753 RepID=UPI003438690A
MPVLLMGGGVPASAAAPVGLFDDFSWGSVSALRKHGWVVRTGTGAPGVAGEATWSAANVGFATVDGSRGLRLTMRTDGTAAGTSQAEVGRAAEKSRAGTYLARIKFADRPESGVDGDHLVETFFAISSVDGCDPAYSETDFSEYLPNGGYDETRTLNTQTSWARAGEECGDSKETDEYRSFAGWHTVMTTVSGGHVRYYLDGKQVADHTGKYYPRHDMTIAFNLWLLDLGGHTGSGVSVWRQSVDYVYYAKNRVLTAKQATARVAAYRKAGKSYVNTL